MLNALKRLLVEPPLRTSQAVQHRLIERVALAVFVSDVLSPVAYASEEILLVPLRRGTGRSWGLLALLRGIE